MPNILLVVGSFHAGGFNKQLAEKITSTIGGRATVRELEYADVPLFRQDGMHAPPDAVRRVRNDVQDADGVWIVTPEYNGSYPGVLKNLFDWLSISLDPKDWRGKSAIHAKKTTVSGVGGSAAKGARSKTEEMLKFIRTDVLTEGAFGITPSHDEWRSGSMNFEADGRAQDIGRHVDAFLKHIAEQARMA